ncbi:hypothetical protein CLNEO_23450 [Anaerotignum neopropionicum]|uniref:Uncharacterized protein n=1 Tax=Anaerotignum neopropionicum TaxID=36847 RepID=A0A136WCG0_9FIRM|nr:hypothetical protein [Anaerotignum neopropionicum]KXL52180.1 hypothetical protein CLNEO_23450 [Anaerotignum neopropionicum]
MKKLKAIIGCLILVCVFLFSYFTTHYQRIQGLDNFPRTDVTVYIYEASLGPIGEDHIQIDQADYESFLQIISSVKYMNPKLDPGSPENLIYGSSDYELEINHKKDNSKTLFHISDYELRPNQRAIYCSDWGEVITAYVKDDVYKEYERLAKKYIKDSKDES